MYIVYMYYIYWHRGLGRPWPNRYSSYMYTTNVYKLDTYVGGGSTWLRWLVCADDLWNSHTIKLGKLAISTVPTGIDNKPTI